MMLNATGVLIVALGDFSFDLYGYSMALISVFLGDMLIFDVFNLTSLK